ncbi:glycosyltransferase [Spongiactinospora rosea]|uniref:glycosyltransferase n=1 Tax=Spongiactinospora rosea TaxID=2248750 RepID=UPI00385160D9
MGWRSHDELPAGLARVDLMAAPAINESFGMVYIEATACGVPPIATSTGGPATLITGHGAHADGWLIPPTTSERPLGGQGVAARAPPPCLAEGYRFLRSRPGMVVRGLGDGAEPSPG